MAIVHVCRVGGAWHTCHCLHLELRDVTSVLLYVCYCECVSSPCFSLAVVAFSGGCDSAALLGMAQEIFSKGVTAVTVDHRWAGMLCDHPVANVTTAVVHLRLRPESSQEAEEAARLAQQLSKAAPQ